MFDLSGRNALVTGASGDIGRAIARALHAQGAKVALSGTRAEALNQLAGELGERAVVVAANLSDPADTERLAKDAEAALGQIDILVNNAGIVVAKPALELTADDWDLTIATNLRGAFLVAQAAARRMAGNGGGSIINIASIAGLRTGGHLAAYAASKAGLIHLTKNLAVDLARNGVRVNAIAPGYIETELNTEFFGSKAGEDMIRRIPQRRLGRPEDLDGPLLLLASDASRYMTGAVLVVDGGHSVNPL